MESNSIRWRYVDAILFFTVCSAILGYIALASGGFTRAGAIMLLIVQVIHLSMNLRRLRAQEK